MSNAEVELVGVHDRICAALAGLQPLFKDDMRLTFLARHPDRPERHLMVSDDPAQAAIQAFVAAGCPELQGHSAPAQSKGARLLTEVDYPLEGL